MPKEILGFAAVQYRKDWERLLLGFALPNIPALPGSSHKVECQSCACLPTPPSASVSELIRQFSPKAQCAAQDPNNANDPVSKFWRPALAKCARNEFLDLSVLKALRPVRTLRALQVPHNGKVAQLKLPVLRHGNWF